MPVHPDELRAIDNLIHEAQERITDQRERLAALERQGQDTTAAREILLVLENSLSLLISRRNLLLRRD